MGQNEIHLYNQRQQERYAARTGIHVDIQNLGKNTDLIAVREQRTRKEIKPGVWLKKSTISFNDGNFSNIYDLSWNQNQIGIVPQIHSSHKPYSLYDQMKRDTDTLAVINGAFFFLTDIGTRKPLDLPYNLCIRDGKIIGLPSSDEPIVYVTQGKLHTFEPKATGEMTIAGKTISWVGANSKVLNKEESGAVLYNSKCSTIIKMRDKKTGVQIGILDEKNIATPKIPNVYDLVIQNDNNGQLFIAAINKGGNTHFFDGLFILQINGKNTHFHVGQTISHITIDGLDLNTITSGITIGKRVSDTFFSTDDRENRRDARSILAKDRAGNIHFIVFDGSKYIPGFNGVSSKDTQPYFSSKKFAWAYFLDGGGSSRIIVREHKELHCYANHFAFRKMKNGLLLWDWKQARQIASSLSIQFVTS